VTGETERIARPMAAHLTSNKLLSVDPGKRKIAYAIWDRATGKLLEAGLVTRDPEVGEECVEHWKRIVESVWLTLGTLEVFDLVIEVPQVYTEVSDKDKNDLLDLAGVVGGIASSEQVASVEWSPKPREWKGQAPKSVTITRVDKRLSPEERARIIWPTVKKLHQDVYDAIHLGLTYLEREGLREIPVPERYPQ
jgi:hypothetical protein